MVIRLSFGLDGIISLTFVAFEYRKRSVSRVVQRNAHPRNGLEREETCQGGAIFLQRTS